MTEAASSSTSPALALRSLTVTLPDGRRLLSNATLDIRAGEFVLLVGRSGSGKTTLLKLIAGFEDDEPSPLTVTGEIVIAAPFEMRNSEFGMRNAESGPPASFRIPNSAFRIPPGGSSASDRPPVAVGMVYQDLALFDELSPLENVRFAIDHRGRRSADSTGAEPQTSAGAEPQASACAKTEARERLRRLNVPLRRRLSELSGGERQRVAVARTLAMDPPILLFDEPTTGLDPYRARAVVDLIARTHREFGRTVIVVSHEFAPFLRHGPRLLLLDSATAALRDVTPDELGTHFAADDTGVLTDTDEKPRTPAVGERVVEGLRGTGAALASVLAGAWTPWLGWRRPRWKVRYLWHFLRMSLIGSTALYVAVAGVMLGFVSMYFGLSQLPYNEVTLPLLTEEFLAASGYSTFRVLAPLLVSALVAGKCGAALAADVGARRLTHQFEAMRSFGVNPNRYLHGNMVIALCAACPLLSVIAFATSCYAALVAYLMTSDAATVAVFRRNFLATVWPSWQAWPTGAGWVLLKMACSGLLIAALAYAIGGRRKASSVDVSRDVGLTIFWSSLGVLAVHSAFSFVEF